MTPRRLERERREINESIILSLGGGGGGGGDDDDDDDNDNDGVRGITHKRAM